jgi:hypothetical protein
MDARDIAGDGQAKSGGAGILVASVVEAVEGAKHVFAFGDRDPGTVILDLDDERAVLPAGAERDAGVGPRAARPQCRC